MPLFIVAKDYYVSLVERKSFYSLNAKERLIHHLVKAVQRALIFEEILKLLLNNVFT